MNGGRRALAALCLVLASGLLVSCDLILSRFLPPPIPSSSAAPSSTAGPISTAAAERTMAPAADVPPDALVATLLSGGGWREVAVPEAGVRLLLPDAWRIVLRTQLPDLGDFEGLPKDAAALERFNEARPQMGEGGQLLAYAIDAGPPGDGSNSSTVMHLTSWKTWDGEGLDELGRILADRRVGPAGWSETATVELAVGEAARVHWWLPASDTQTAGPDEYSYVEYVFLSPNANPYTLSFLVAGDRVDEQWPMVMLISSTMRGL